MSQVVDLTGRIFGRLSVVEATTERKRGQICWKCRCVCGKEPIIVGWHLRTGKARSCGCLKIKNLMGQRFGHLLVVAATERRSASGGACWLCKCDCGVIKTIPGNALQSGNTASCGCQIKEQTRNRGIEIGNRSLALLTGKRFGRLTVISRIPAKRPTLVCKCDCGNTATVRADHLRSHKIRSCGCLVTDTITKHGLSKTLEYGRQRNHKRRRATRKSAQHFTAQEILKRLQQQHGRCYLCNKPLRKRLDTTYVYEVDHWNPISKSADNSAKNIRIMHPMCNRSKGAKLPTLLAKERNMLLLG